MGLEGPLGGALYPNGTIEPLSRFVPSTFRDWRRDVPKGTMAAGARLFNATFFVSNSEHFTMQAIYKFLFVILVFKARKGVR
jgi:hypothetical protein